MEVIACPICNRNGCDCPAAGVLAVDFYPPKALMRHYGVFEPLTQMVMGLELCEEHAHETVPSVLLGESLAVTARVVEEATGTKVDIEACRVVLLPFDHPDVARMRAVSTETRS
jgi:hypothetical protein